MGVFSSSLKPSRDLLDLHGKVAIVTGGNAGIGFWTVAHLSRRGAKVYLLARNESKATEAIVRIKALDSSPGNGEVKFLHLDLNDPREVKKSAESFLKLEDRLDILVNNAGIMSSPYEETKEGIVNSMVINHLSPFVLVNTLSPLLEKTAQEPSSDVRVVTVASTVHTLIKDSDVKFDTLESLNTKYESSWMSNMKRYAQSKLANILWTNELQRRYDDEGIPITCIAIHPGGVYTDTALDGLRKLPLWWLIFLITRPFSDLPEPGSFTSLFAAASKAVAQNPAQYRGRYLAPYGKIAATSPLASNTELAKTLWGTTEKVLKDVYDL